MKKKKRKEWKKLSCQHSHPFYSIPSPQGTIHKRERKKRSESKKCTKSWRLSSNPFLLQVPFGSYFCVFLCCDVSCLSFPVSSFFLLSEVKWTLHIIDLRHNDNTIDKYCYRHSLIRYRPSLSNEKRLTKMKHPSSFPTHLLIKSTHGGLPLPSFLSIYAQWL